MSNSMTDELYAFKPTRVKKYPDVVCSYAKGEPIQYRRHGTKEWIDWNGSLELLAKGFDWRPKEKKLGNLHTDDKFMYENKLLDDYETPNSESITLTDPLVWRITQQTGPAVGEKSEQEKALDEMTEWAEANKLYDDYTLDKDFQKAFMDALDKHDNVTSPRHYNTGSIECIDGIRASMSDEAFKGYLKGNCQKYLWRYSYKNGLEDLQKARWYLEYLIDMEAE